MGTINRNVVFKVLGLDEMTQGNCRNREGEGGLKKKKILKNLEAGQE